MTRLVLALALSLPAMAKKPPKQTPQQMAEAAVDQGMAAAVAAQQAAAASGDIHALTAWAGALTGAAEAGSIGRDAIAEADLDAFFVAVQAAQGDAQTLGQLQGYAAKVAAAADRMDQARSLAAASLDTAPTSTALLTWLQVATDRSQAAQHCTATLGAATSDIQRFDILSACNAALGISWSSPEDQAWLETESTRRKSSQAAHLAGLQQRWAEEGAAAAEAAAERAQAAAEAARTQASAAPAGPQLVSVSMHITCKDKVRIFTGSSPTSGGTYGWESSNSTRNLTLNAGDVLCITDDRDKVQSCWTASGSSVRLDVGCGGFMQR